MSSPLVNRQPATDAHQRLTTLGIKDSCIHLSYPSNLFHFLILFDFLLGHYFRFHFRFFRFRRLDRGLLLTGIDVMVSPACYGCHKPAAVDGNLSDQTYTPDVLWVEGLRAAPSGFWNSVFFEIDIRTRRLLEQEDTVVLSHKGSVANAATIDGMLCLFIQKT